MNSYIIFNQSQAREILCISKTAREELKLQKREELIIHRKQYSLNVASRTSR